MVVDLAVVTVDIASHLVPVGIVVLPGRPEVEPGVLVERLRLVDMREQQQAFPVRIGQLALQARRALRYDLACRQRSVAGEHAAGEEAVAGRVDRELPVAIQVALRAPRVEGLHQCVHLDDLHVALQPAAAHQPQRDRTDDAEQTVAADGQPEQVRLLAAAHATQPAISGHQRERFDVGHERREVQATAMDVGREGTANRQPVGTSLLLAERPRRQGLASRFGLQAIERLQQLRPLHARLDLDQAALYIELQHAVAAGQIDQPAGLPELLPAHRMASAADRDRDADAPCARHRGRHFEQVARMEGAQHRCRVQPRVQVVDPVAVGQGGAAGQWDRQGDGKAVHRGPLGGGRSRDALCMRAGIQPLRKKDHNAIPLGQQADPSLRRRGRLVPRGRRASVCFFTTSRWPAPTPSSPH